MAGLNFRLSVSPQSERMDTPSLDTLMRVAAFERVRGLNEIHDHLTATELQPGFLFRGERIPLVKPPNQYASRMDQDQICIPHHKF